MLNESQIKTVEVEGLEYRLMTDETSRLRRQIQVISEQYHGPLSIHEESNTIMPMVLVLGNHSSGKSSFINHLFGINVQSTGVAPTDDCFTIISYSSENSDASGETVIGDKILGFQGLSQFGPLLVHKTQLKLRKDIAIRNLMIVDTPGMIDSPISRSTPSSNVLDRGYDFQSVCRWYAQRADVILLFFDPDKPGTTGETLSILVHSLQGMDHKLHIILNKADQFKKIHDFARAYGSLCWNLSKVIPRKDLPQIHTMCLPRKLGSESDLITVEASFLNEGFYDLEQSRNEVVKEVLYAPKRRIDNEIARLSESTLLLRMHLKIMNEIVCKYKWNVKYKYLVIGGAITALTLSTAAIAFNYAVIKKLFFGLWSEKSIASQNSEVSSTVSTSGGSFVDKILRTIKSDSFRFTSTFAFFGSISIFGLTKLMSFNLTNFSKYLTSREGLHDAFLNQYKKYDMYMLQLWEILQKRNETNLTSQCLEEFDDIEQHDIQLLDRILDIDIPELRRRASPSFTKLPAKPFQTVTVSFNIDNTHEEAAVEDESSKEAFETKSEDSATSEMKDSVIISIPKS